VARAAEIDRGGGVEGPRVEDGLPRLLDAVLLDRRDVTGAGTVAGFAGDTGDEMGDVDVARAASAWAGVKSSALIES